MVGLLGSLTTLPNDEICDGMPACPDQCIGGARRCRCRVACGGGAGDGLALHGVRVGGIADDRQVHAFYLEWRSRPRWYGLAPYVFGSWRETGASYLGAGLLYTVSLSPQWKLTASSGPGYYERDGELDLGSRLEFASTLELAYRFASGRRIALGVGHISNAGAGRINPGSEYIRLGFQFPISDR